MKTKQSCLQEVNKHDVDTELSYVPVTAPFTEHYGKKAKHGLAKPPQHRNTSFK